MTIKQKVKLNMFLAVRNIRNKFIEITKKMTKFEQAFAVLMSYVDQIQAVSEQQSINKTGSTADKNKLKKKLISLTFKYSMKLSYLAKSRNNETLLKEVQLNQSDLKTKSGVEVRDSAQIIYDRVEANLQDLSEDGVTIETQKAFLETINAFNNALSIPRSGIVEKSQATQKLSVLYEQAEEAMRMLDIAVESARDEQADFYIAYKGARKLVDINSGKIVLRGVAVDFSSREPLKGVFFRFRPAGLKLGSMEIVKKTAAKGRFNLKSIDPGTYTVQISKPGYKQKDENVVVSGGESNQIVVELERE